MSLPQEFPVDQVEKIHAVLGDQQVYVIKQDGLVGWTSVYPAIRLAAENVTIEPGDRILLFGCHQGALPAYMSLKYPHNPLAVIYHDYSALEASRKTLKINKIPIDSIRYITDAEMPEVEDDKFDVVIMLLPKGRSLARKWLIQIYYGLASTGQLYIAGANREGIQSVLKDASDVFGGGRVLAYGKGNRICQFSAAKRKAGLPGWASNPGISPGSWVEFTVEIQGNRINIHSLPGIFSYDHLDEGTRMLLNAIEIPPGAKVLDAGCGYGVIGITAAMLGAGKVDLIDNNLLAVAASHETIHVNQVNSCTALAGDLLEPLTPLQYDLVLSNPPFHAGHAVEYQMARSIIAQSYLTLVPGGQVVIVANRFIRYDRLIKDIFGNCTILMESNKFYVLRGLKL
ncbi:MAG: hypothetical protein C3F13_10675 [Anaerolineales bacterium]|nr:methyltransferase [Anaerolineae bacterium]PWB53072.1 MAG: hypothetical protein C3F13_10675 [Anaerolineales bacterium]